jgi:hypothetical protein
MKQLVEYAGRKQVMIGLGTDIGIVTALGRPGSQGYEKIDGLTYASWGYSSPNLRIMMAYIGNSGNIQASRPRFTLFSQILQ